MALEFNLYAVACGSLVFSALAKMTKSEEMNRLSYSVAVDLCMCA